MVSRVTPSLTYQVHLCRYPSPRPSCALGADGLAIALIGVLASVVHQETVATPELVGLHRQDLHRQFLVGELGARKLEALGHIDLVDVDTGRLCVGPP